VELNHDGEASWTYLPLYLLGIDVKPKSWVCMGEGFGLDVEK